MASGHPAIEHQMWAAVAELRPTLQPSQNALVENSTLFGVFDEPSNDQLKAAHVSRGYTLLGLTEIYKPPTPARVTLFAGPITRTGASVPDVTHHEIGHRLDLGYHGVAGMASLVAGDDGMLCDMCAVPGSKSCGCSSKAAAATVLQNYQVNEKRQVMAQQIPWTDDCPVCNVWSKLNEADGLLANASMETSLQHVIPAGLGGTIPLARYRVQQATNQFALAAGMVNPTAGMTEQLRSSLKTATGALGAEGTILTPDELRVAAQAVHTAQLQAFQFTWAYWAPQYT